MAKDKPKKEKSELKPKKAQFVVKLSVEGCRDFANWMTSNDPAGTAIVRRYKDDPDLATNITNLLDGIAEVYEDGAKRLNVSLTRQKNKIHIEKDKPAGRKIQYPIAAPTEICETIDGEIDLDYLISYVDGLKNMPEEGAAYALLGMYFFSRCR